MRQAYNKHRNNKVVVKDDFITFIKNSVIYKDLLFKKNRTVYKEFLKDLQKITEVKENKKLNDFLKLWDKEISNNVSDSRDVQKREFIMKPITKKACFWLETDLAR